MTDATRDEAIKKAGDEAIGIDGCVNDVWLDPAAFRRALAEKGMCIEQGWQPIETAPKDGTWILGINNRGNQAVIIWKDRPNGIGDFRSGWIHPFSGGQVSSFWNGACGSVPTHWRPLPAPPSAAEG